MKPDPQICPKCASPMERGWILDVGHSSAFQAAWIAGEPQASLFGAVTGGKSTHGRQRLPIDAYRCTGCGFLEFYASADGR